MATRHVPDRLPAFLSSGEVPQSVFLDGLGINPMILPGLPRARWTVGA